MLAPRFLAHFVCYSLAVISLATLGGRTTFGDDEPLPPKLPGLVASFAAADDSEEPLRRVDLSMQHSWTQPSELDPRLALNAPVDGAWRGALEVNAEGTYQLHLHVAGKVRLMLDGRAIISGESAQGAWLDSEPLELSFGAHHLELHYQSSPSTASSPYAGELGLYWQGPGFAVEPITQRYLTHASADTPSDDFERGRLLAYALRCAACHRSSPVSAVLPAPDLTRLDGNLNPQWLQPWLVTNEPAHGDRGDRRTVEDITAEDLVDRRMPHFALNAQDAADIAEALWSHSLPTEAEAASTAPAKPAEASSEQRPAAGKKQSQRTEPDAAEGRKLFDTRGCLACHTLSERELGMIDLENDATYLPHNRLEQLTRELFAGGDLSDIASKRPAEFFERWLTDPARINASHRMPTTALGALERADVALYLGSLKRKSAANAPSSARHSIDEQTPKGDAGRGKRLIAENRCGVCHTLPASLQSEPPVAGVLTADSRWDAGCLDQPNPVAHIPGFRLSAGQRRALKLYWTAAQPVATRPVNASHGAEQRSTSEVPADLLLAEKNCTACHARGSGQGIGPRTVQLAAVEHDLAAQLPALQPPSLTGVGDKLHEQALHAAIEQSEAPRRPWLEVRMPKYSLDAADRDRIVGHLIKQDRIPERASKHTTLVDDVVTRAAAGRLVTSEGFGCQSCHQIAKQLPPTVTLNARGTDLTMLGKRIRRSWFDRWVRNPVRIVPRMEMPAIQLPVPGVLGGDLDRQIDSLWEMLNTEGFQPPSPAPVRVVRGHNRPGVSEPAHVLTDILETPTHVYLRPLTVGLGNRQNVLFDLGKGELGQWWIGDTARELTRGKSWYWELGGQPLGQKLSALANFALRDADDRVWPAKPREQFAVQFDALRHTASGIVWSGRIHFAHQSQEREVPVELSVEPLTNSAASSSGITIALSLQLPRDFGLIVQLDPLSGELSESRRHEGQARSGWSASIDARSEATLRPIHGNLARISAHEVLLSVDEATSDRVQLAMELETQWPIDEFIEAATRETDSVGDTANRHPIDTTQPVKLDVVPGFEGIQLPLPRTEMPTALAWYRGDLIAASLKGRVLRALDRDGDHLADTWQPLSDDLPAPYGVATGPNGIDVVAKYGVLRLSDPELARSEETEAAPWPMRVVADGWGYTADYHDWAVGLVPDGQGNYFVALPCQQDDRSPSAAKLRGTVQKLIPQSPTSEDPRAFRLETFCAGQRFPMGLAFDRDGELFATDNQGNYNPFNELNHLQPGKRYGFINKLENRPGFNPPLESPAINLPHPWTRSVNGICFLNTPATAGSGNLFGPYEGHLIGCEYNGLSLIRMSLEKIDGVYQGAAYPFSRPPVGDEPTFEGPVACAVAPSGELYVGSIHDSGWGGGQNTGSIVRLAPSGHWPLGIGTLRALKDGLSIEFTGPVDASAAGSPDNYSVRSYRRVSTPAYGGADQDERQEKVLAAHCSPDRKRVELRLDDLRADCVYELHIGAVAGEGQKLFPSEAHYTMKRVPK